MDYQTYASRVCAIEGRVFYENKLTAPEYVRTYFPPTQGETNYDRRPKISFPVTGEIVDRLASLVYSGMQVTFENTQDEALWDEIAERNNFLEQARSMVTQPLATGNQLTVIHNTGGAFWQNWGGEFSQYMTSAFYSAGGFEYVETKGTANPVTSAIVGNKPKGYVSTMIDELFFIQQFGEQVIITEHGLPFAPFVFCTAVDIDSSNRYASPFCMRFKELLIEYNLIMSQISKAVRILQNVIVTNKELDNPNFPLRIDPDTIQHVGKEGFLQQMVRELNIEPELAMCSRLKQHIASRAQVPEHMTGLEGVGKVESGVALQIVMGPLTELIDRIRPVFHSRVSELIDKSMQVEYRFRGKQREAKFHLELSESILPTDMKAEIELLLSIVAANVLPPKYLASLQSRIASLLNLKEETV